MVSPLGCPIGTTKSLCPKSKLSPQTLSFSLPLFVLVPPTIQYLSQKAGHLGLCPQFPHRGVTKSNQFYLLIFFIFSPFSPLTATILVQNLPCNRSLCPCLAFLLLLATPPAEQTIAVTALNSSTSPCASRLHADNEALLWPALQSQVLPVPLTPMLTVAHSPLGVGNGLSWLFSSGHHQYRHEQRLLLNE